MKLKRVDTIISDVYNAHAPFPNSYIETVVFRKLYLVLGFYIECKWKATGDWNYKTKAH